MDSGAIIHPGIIEEISRGKILVKILSQSACSTCHAKGACSVSEVEEKIIEIDHPPGQEWKTGDQVMVMMEQSLGWTAVFLGYLTPLIILIVSIIVFLTLLKHEGLAALLSIFMLVPYYFVLYLSRKRLKRKFNFRIERSA